MHALSDRLGAVGAWFRAGRSYEDAGIKTGMQAVHERAERNVRIVLLRIWHTTGG